MQNDNHALTQENLSRPKKLTLLIAKIISAPLIIYSAMMIVGYAVNWLTTGQADPYAVDNYPFVENLPPLFMFIAILGLAIAWKFEKAGGLINIAFSGLTLLVLLSYRPITSELRTLVPLFLLAIVLLPGILFFVYSQKSKRIDPTVDISQARED